MTEVFGQYADWYDAFNRDKDYAAESGYILNLAKRWLPSPRSWLDLGCGSGNHLMHLRARGLAVEGIDSSATMIARAQARMPDVPLHVGTLQELRLGGRRDVISMLFHVMSYQVSDSMVRDALNGVAAHLSEEGVFIFDFWHGDAVLWDPPASRIRQITLAGRPLFRISRPTEDRARHRVDVRFEFRWDSPTGELAHEELHAMRHFTAADLDGFLHRAGLRVLACEGWMGNRPLSKDDWYGVICAAKR